MWGARHLGWQTLFFLKKMATVFSHTDGVTAVSSEKLATFFLVIAVAFIHFTRSLGCRPLFPACKKLPLLLWAPLFVGAPVRPNMLNLPKSAVGPCVLLAYDLCPQHFRSVRQLLSYCASAQQCSVKDKSTHLICKAHTHTM